MVTRAWGTRAAASVAPAIPAPTMAISVVLRSIRAWLLFRKRPRLVRDEMSPAAILLLILAAMLVVAAAGDIRARIIPNRLNIAVALLAPAYWWATGATGGEILLHLGLAVALLAFFGALFAAGMMGGGDVKLITVLALWLPPMAMLNMLVWMAVGGGALTVLMLIIHAARRAPGRPEVPYGVAIVGATMLVMANDILTRSAA
jgi:prepilin peptidase CpaA